jgi:hypothetical protein
MFHAWESCVIVLPGGTFLVSADVEDAPRESKGNRQIGGRPRKWEKLWEVIQEQDAKTPKPKDARIASIYNQKYANHLPKANAKTVTNVRRRYRKYEESNTPQSETSQNGPF